MLRHQDIWAAIDRLAAKKGLSPSGLARRAELDPTTFNPSKRKTPQGKQRWPSTESVAKVLKATGTTFAEFAGLTSDQPGAGPLMNIPVIGYAQAGAEGYFDDAGYPVGSGWDEVRFPDLGDPNAYALEISGDSMEPLYRAGDIIIVSPDATVRRGDRVVLRTTSGEVMAKELAQLSDTALVLKSANPAHEDRQIPRQEVEWIARILWASQ